MIVDEQPLLFHTGPRGMFPLVREAVAHVLPPDKLRCVAFSHYETDECGAANLWLGAAPEAQLLCSRVAAMVQGDSFDRAVRARWRTAKSARSGAASVRWFDAPHVPHGWDCGFLAETTHAHAVLRRPLHAARRGRRAADRGRHPRPERRRCVRGCDYFAASPQTRATLERLAAFEPRTLACMHGSSFNGNGSALLRELSRILSPASP